MAFDKAKALKEAQNYVSQGKTARAIKYYQRIVENDPGDLTLLNVIGDLYAQDNNLPEALKYFYRLADAYTKEGYNVKAIAIYKKISKLDRDSVEPSLRLAELNAAQGLAREAREQYKLAFGFFERTSQRDKALGILRKLCQLEPQSPVLRLKLAQFAEGAGEIREAADAYLETVALAQQHGDTPLAESALNKAAELAPENPEVHLYRARQALANQNPQEVQAILGAVPELQNNSHAQRLLLESYLVAHNLEAAQGLLLEVFQSNPSDFSLVAAFAEQCIEKQQYDAALEALRAAAPELMERRETAPLMETLRKLWNAAPERIDTLDFAYQVAEKTADEATIPEVLEALGNAHVQSGQFEKAEQAYARLVAREPENETYKDLLRQVLEKQGKEYVPLGQIPFISSDMGLEAGTEPAREGATGGSGIDFQQAAIVKGAVTNSDLYIRDGLTERAVEELEKVLRIYPDQVDIQKRILEACRETLPGRAVQAAEALARVHAGQGEGSEAKRYHEEAQALAEAAAHAAGATQPGEVGETPPPMAEIDLSQPGAGAGAPEDEVQLPPPQEIPLQFETSRGAEDSAGPGAAPQEPRESASSGPAQQSQVARVAPPFNYEESREEVEFYLRHGFHDEAAKAVSELERNYPGESRVAEFRQRVDESSRQSHPPERFQPAPGTVAEETGRELPTSFSGTTEAGSLADSTRLPAESGTARGRPGAVENLAGELASSLNDLDDLSTAAAASASPPYPALPPATDASAELGSLLDELNDNEGPTDQTAGDDETHYNLGVAFREMGLLDEAIGEFQKVVKSGGASHLGPNFLQGCTLLAACFMDKGMPLIAAKWYARALDAPGLDPEGKLAVYYDLGIAFEKAGDTTAALEKFTEVYSQNIDYRDVAEKIRLLRQSTR